jgi:hypothetical protein
MRAFLNVDAGEGVGSSEAPAIVSVDGFQI